MKLQFAVPVAVVVLAISVSTVLEGQLTERYPFAPARTEKLSTFTERLRTAVPSEIGPWVSEVVPLDPKEFKASNCDYAVSLKYINSVTGETVDVYLVSGVARHVTIHTPDKCYPGAGFVMQGDPDQVRLKGDAEQEFITAAFRKEDTTGAHHLRIFWSFSDDGRWHGPRKPKPAFAGRPALYKLYLITPTETSELREEESAGVAFAELFLPIVSSNLFSDRQSSRQPTDSQAKPAETGADPV